MPPIYAVCDVVDRLLSAPVELAEGMVVAESLFGSGGGRPDHEGIPTAADEFATLHEPVARLFLLAQVAPAAAVSARASAGVNASAIDISGPPQ